MRSTAFAIRELASFDDADDVGLLQGAKGSDLNKQQSAPRVRVMAHIARLVGNSPCEIIHVPDGLCSKGLMIRLLNHDLGLPKAIG